MDDFAWATGLVINFHKSCFIPMHTEAFVASAIASVLGCPISSFPQPYLGLPLSPTKLPNSAFAPLLLSFDRRLSGRDFADPPPSPSFLERIVAACLPLYRSITRVTVVDGRSTSFWLDKWLPGEPLATRFPALFSHSTRPHASVASVVSLGLDLQSRLTGTAEDELRVVKIFAYLLDIDRLSTRVNLFHKGCASSSACAACGAPETGRHLFFDCPRAVELWAALEVPIPIGGFSIWDLQGPSQTSTGTWQFGLATVLWSIWKSRNDLVFNGVAHSTASTLRRAGDDLSLWRWRLRSPDREPLDRLRSRFLTRAVAYNNTLPPPPPVLYFPHVYMDWLLGRFRV
ncbi:hypothetical protein QYE76_032690 [Lolium multiflorum]|uniref:Reverse transcriptase zinc-binding domain-containing protein n=1 Tax=Lolium multiflorum TaxID=4521 RepID=A0AAD8VIK7_LOLMU|nr:hypothetical protein QYE76_032690 [Lolium multiflorum]